MFEVAPQLGPYEIFEIERIITKGSCFDFDLRRFIFPLGSFDHDWIFPYVSITFHIVFSSFTLSFPFLFDAFTVRSLSNKNLWHAFCWFYCFSRGYNNKNEDRRKSKFKLNSGNPKKFKSKVKSKIQILKFTGPRVNVYGEVCIRMNVHFSCFGFSASGSIFKLHFSLEFRWFISSIGYLG